MSDYKNFMHIHSLHITTPNIKVSVFTRRCWVTALNNGHFSVSVLNVLAGGDCLTTNS